MAGRDREPSDSFYTDFDYDQPVPRTFRPAPGKSTLTSRMAAPAQTNIIFRVADPATARALGQAMQPRDDNGVAADADDAVARANGSTGSPLPAAVRQQFEASTQADLSSVRVHTGAESEEAALAVGAKAYTLGSDIHFAPGQYQPSQDEGLKLLAHEVAHTVQQQGGATRRQHKLFVSTSTDVAEVEADRAAEAMVAGQATQLAPAGDAVSRTLSRQADAAAIEQAGDAAAAAAQGAPLEVDSASVTVDRSQVGELLKKIADQKHRLEDAAKAGTLDTVIGGDPLHALSVNSATEASLQIFDDRLQDSNVDTKAFACQFRLANAEYQRLKAEAQQWMGEKGVSAAGLTLDEGMPQYNAFRTARKALHTAAKKMDAKLTNARGAASKYQGAVYNTKAAVARAKADKAKEKLARIREEIEGAAKNASRIVKLASGVAGLAGGGGELNAMGKEMPEAELRNTTILRSPDNIFANPTPGHYELHDTHVNPEGEGPSKSALLAAMGKDGSELAGLEASEVAEKLVKAVGTYAEHGKIAGLKAEIAQEEARNDTLKAAGSAQMMVGYAQSLEGSVKELQLNVTAFKDAKTEMTRARNALMKALEKKGAKGKKQAKAVLFLSDTDQFLAQVRNAISVGKNQQDRLSDAAKQRKALRGSIGAVKGRTAGMYDGEDNATKSYYECQKTKVKGRLWGSNEFYRLTKVDISFGDSGGFSGNDRVQGGQGSVEGVGGADDVVAKNIKVLEENAKKAKILQSQVQAALGVGGPGSNA